MGTHINRIIGAMENNDMDSAKKYTSMVVRRSTDKMDSHHIASAAIETIAEGFVDGYLTPLFFYAFFGLAGAMVAKVVNTMDSNVAYRDNTHYEFGRCTAIGDSITNLIINTVPVLAVLYILYISGSTILLILFILIYAYFHEI